MDVSQFSNFLTDLYSLASFLFGTSLHLTFADCVTLANREQKTPVVIDGSNCHLKRRKIHVHARYVGLL
jgi:hypothetical protein